jgi:hypothetical protein
VPDLAHHPEHVEPVREQRNRDVCPPERVRRRVRQRGQAASEQTCRRQLGRLADDRVRSLARHAAAAHIGEEICVGLRRQAGALEAVEMGDELLKQIWADLHLAHARLGLCVGNTEVRATRGMQPQVADTHIADLADTDAGSAERRHDRAAADM